MKYIKDNEASLKITLNIYCFPPAALTDSESFVSAELKVKHTPKFVIVVVKFSAPHFCPANSQL